MPLTLAWTDATRLPVDGASLRPDALDGLSSNEVARLPLGVGNGTAELGALFRVSGDASDGHLVIEGDMPSVRDLGRGLTSGRLSIIGEVGDGLGAEMTGGRIEVQGSVGHWAGAALRGGILTIHGSAGDHLGAAWPGARLGMRDGVILVDGSVGSDCGLAMRRGLIALTGPAGAGLGRDLIAGSIFAFGPVGPRAGAGMKRGTLALFGSPHPELLPTFRAACRYRPPFITLYLRHLRSLGFPVPDPALSGPFERHNGDLLALGKGEILLWSGG